MKKLQLSYKSFLIVFIISVLITFFVPVFIFLSELGYFKPEPKLETVSTVNDDDAPVLRVVADYDFAPRSFYDEDEKYSGIDIEIATEIANRLGYKISFSFGDWPACKKMLQQGEADLILGLEIFSNMQGVLKTIPISHDSLSIYGKNEISEAGSLAGKRVGLMANSVITSLFDLNCEFVEFYTNTAILKAVDEGEIDYGICHASISSNIIRKENLNIVPSFALMESFPAIGVRADRPELREQINAVLKEMSDDGFIADMETKWIKNYLQIKSVRNVLVNNQSFFIIYAIFFIIFIFILVITLQSLKSQAYKQQQYELLSSIADIYMSMHFLDLKKKTSTMLNQISGLKKLVEEKIDVTKRIETIIKETVQEEYREQALTFTDITTLSERMENKQSISAVFLGETIGWFRAQFIAVGKNQRGDVESVIFTVQNIDEEKKRMDQLIHISNIDELTGLYNRHAYKVDCDGENTRIPDDFIYVSFDVNGLKKMNDTKGHAAGDELLKATADCLFDAIHSYGKVYRIGGDEMCAMIHMEKKQFKEMMKELDKRLLHWHGVHIDGISVSYGVVFADELEASERTSVEDISKIADERMYTAKREYHKRLGD